ncbi:cytochrome P450 [Mycolicibacterium austroafricanum]|jgi:cytochrome P450|uniref:cytochrome P450 n=1 Tax=Mycolicibacterium austroafricanum TaxID=39687 RepID=UPI000AB622E7|nr:cytochrome P450 [Mycolicibacterium austroafricanum]QZY47048.1 cytochrome P450 [Mycolicibacterium austroafricanum]
MSDDPFGPTILEDPSDFHRNMRERGPIVYLSRYDVYGMGRYNDVHAALIDWQSFESAAGVGLSNFRYEKPWRPPSLLLESNPPRHDAPRGVLSAILNVRALKGLRDNWIADAAALVDELCDRREVDAVADIARVFPLRVFPDAVGIGRTGRDNLLPYGDHLFNAFGPSNELVAKGAHRIGELSAWVMAQCERAALRDEVIDGQPTFGAQIWAAADRGDITYEQAPLVVRSLLSAGVDTTVLGISAVLAAFAHHPDQWRAVRDNPALARVAFDEAVRWESPVQTFFRTATKDIAIGDHVVPDGKKILMFLGSANRDPRRWADPDQFDLRRNPSGHVGFGMGIHQCVGQHVARLEAEALLVALTQRFESIAMTGTPRRHHNNTLRAWETLPITLTPA